MKKTIRLGTILLAMLPITTAIACGKKHQDGEIILETGIKIEDGKIIVSFANVISTDEDGNIPYEDITMTSVKIYESIAINFAEFIFNNKNELEQNTNVVSVDIHYEANNKFYNIPLTLSDINEATKEEIASSFYQEVFINKATGDLPRYSKEEIWLFLDNAHILSGLQKINLNSFYLTPAKMSVAENASSNTWDITPSSSLIVPENTKLTYSKSVDGQTWNTISGLTGVSTSDHMRVSLSVEDESNFYIESKFLENDSVSIDLFIDESGIVNKEKNALEGIISGYWDKSEFRDTIKNDAIFEDTTFKLPDYTTERFINDFVFTNYNYSIATMAANFANIINENDDNILAWRNSKPNTTRNDHALIFFDGGPIFEAPFGEQNNLDAINTAEDLYQNGKYGVEYILQEAQWGINPISIFDDAGSTSSTNKYFDAIRNDANYDILANKFDNNINDVTLYEKLSILMGDTTVSGGDVQRAMSMAYSTIDADRTYLLTSKLKESYSNVNLAGFSHGFWVASDVLILGDDILSLVDNVAVEGSSLNAAIEGSYQPSGAYMDAALVEEWKNAGASDQKFGTEPLELDFAIWSRVKWKTEFGHMNRMSELFENNSTLISKYKEQVWFSFIEYDWNTGYITQPERDWYATNDMNLDIRDGLSLGHQTLGTEDYFDKIFNYQ